MTLADLLRGAIMFETALTPPVPIPVSGSSDSSVTPAMLKWLKVLRPKITIPVIYDPHPVVIAPWGDPGKTMWPWVEAAIVGTGVAIGGVATYAVVSLLLPRRKD